MLLAIIKYGVCIEECGDALFKLAGRNDMIFKKKLYLCAFGAKTGMNDCLHLCQYCNMPRHCVGWRSFCNMIEG